MRDLIIEIVHKLRTPVVAIQTSSSGIKYYLPILIAAYREARKTNCDITDIQEHQLDILERILNNIENEANFINKYLDDITAKELKLND